MNGRSDIAQHIVVACRRLYDRGYVTATDGNVSARLPNGNVLVTPTSMNKGVVGERDLVEASAAGKAVSLDRKPSTELPLHLFVYNQRHDVNAVVHAHPPYATGFAAARIPLPDAVFPEVIIGLGAIPLAPYATPSTGEVAESLRPFVKDANAVLLANHGVVTFGTNVEEAYYRMEKVEHAAQIIFIARMLGGEKPLQSHEVARLRAAVEGKAGLIPEVKPESGSPEHDVKQLIRELLEEKLRTRN